MIGCTSNAAGARVSEQQVAEGRARKARNDCQVTDLQIHVSIVSHMGVLTQVALALGIRLPALFRRIERAPQLRACRDAARASLVSVAWDQLGKAVEAKARWTTLFVLSHHSGTEPNESFAHGPHEPQETIDPEDLELAARYAELRDGVLTGKIQLPLAPPVVESKPRANAPFKMTNQPADVSPRFQEIFENGHVDEPDAKACRLILEREARPPAAPPVVESKPRADAQFKMTNQPADVSPRFQEIFGNGHVDEPDAKACRLILEREARPLAAPPVVESKPRANAQFKMTTQPADVSPRFQEIFENGHVDEPDAQACRLILEREARPLAAPPVVESKPRANAPFKMTTQPADVSPRFQVLFENGHVDEPDAKACRLILEREARPPAAPPVVESEPRADAQFKMTNQPADVSPRFQVLFENGHVDEPDAKACPLILEREARPPAAPPVVESELRADAQFKMTNQPADVSPRFQEIFENGHVDEPDAKECRLILEREARPPAAPPVVESEPRVDQPQDGELNRGPGMSLSSKAVLQS